MPLRRALLHVLVACSLLFAQAGAHAHAVGHALQDSAGQPAQGDGKTVPHSVFCAQWLSLPGLYAPPAAHVAQCTATNRGCERPAEPRVSFLPQFIPVFSSRAPPLPAGSR